MWSEIVIAQLRFYKKIYRFYQGMREAGIEQVKTSSLSIGRCHARDIAVDRKSLERFNCLIFSGRCWTLNETSCKIRTLKISP